MPHLTARLIDQLRLIGSAVGFGDRLIADGKGLKCHCENPALAGDEAIAYARVDRRGRQAGLAMTRHLKHSDQAEGSFKRSR